MRILGLVGVFVLAACASTLSEPFQPYVEETEQGPRVWFKLWQRTEGVQLAKAH